MSSTADRTQSTLRGRRKHVVLAVAALATLSLTTTACNGAQKEDAKAGVTYDTAPKQSADLAGQPSSDSDPGMKKAGGNVPNCKTSDLDIKGFSQSKDGSEPAVARKTEQQHTSVGMKNTSDHACVLNGFPGVTFVGGKKKDPADNTGKTDWALPRSGDKAEPVTLQPGKQAWTPLTFLSENEDGDKDGWYPKQVEITPPNETRSVTLDWPWGNILLQDGASRSGTYVHPVSTKPGAGQ
ncbi:DUF4232 domain-containing protein [Streptomyces sp. NPDC046821]|uniref:DUF4232 domain-containing protein n=1 Tax=Streptomyces sp. NPDC046821 TaxID=3154702 RepID=UPI0033C8500D